MFSHGERLVAAVEPKPAIRRSFLLDRARRFGGQSEGRRAGQSGDGKGDNRGELGPNSAGGHSMVSRALALAVGLSIVLDIALGDVRSVAEGCIATPTAVGAPTPTAAPVARAIVGTGAIAGIVGDRCLDDPLPDRRIGEVRLGVRRDRRAERAKQYATSKRDAPDYPDVHGRLPRR